MEEKTEAGAAPQPGAHRSGCFVCGTAIPMLERLWSKSACDHFRSSRVEFLKGIRSLIDDHIAHLSQQERKGTHVTIE